MNTGVSSQEKMSRLHTYNRRKDIPGFELDEKDVNDCIHTLEELVNQ